MAKDLKSDPVKENQVGYLTHCQTNAYLLMIDDLAMGC